MSSSPTPQPLPASVRARIYHPFKKVWTPRTPDSSYDSFAGLTPPFPFVQPFTPSSPLLDTQLDPKTQQTLPVFVGVGVTIENAVYLANIVVGEISVPGVGVGVKLQSGTYTHP